VTPPLLLAPNRNLPSRRRLSRYTDRASQAIAATSLEPPANLFWGEHMHNRSSSFPTMTRRPSQPSVRI
jgi:hypothetical protein